MLFEKVGFQMLRLAEDPEGERGKRMRAAEEAREMVNLLFEHRIDL